MPQLNIYPEAGMGGETVVGSDDVSHHVMSQESFVNGEKSEDSDVPSYQLGLSAQELNDPAKIVVTIADKQTPVVVLFGSPSCGKTMTLVRLSRYLHSLGYTVDPVRSFRPAFDSHYAEMCDTFSRTVNSDEAAESTRFMNFMLVIVRKDGRPVCQILEAPGEYYFNPKNPGMQFPPYVQAIISATNRKIWGIMLEPDWMNASDRANYVDRIRMVNRNRRSYDRAIFIYNKIDRLPG